MKSSLLKKYFAIQLSGFNTITYWKERGKKYGERAVLNLAYTPKEMDAVTQKQKSIIFPKFKKYLGGNEKNVLDFGCGPGRFTKDLSSIINGIGVGIDPVKDFIAVAQEKDQTNKYLVVDDYTIPFADNYFDIIWVCLVLGGIKDNKLRKVKKEILRVSKPDTLFVLVENTTSQPNHKHWYYRSADFYIEYFKEFNLTIEERYSEFQEDISIMIGKRSYANISHQK